jgi:hypothetical protein
MEEALDILIDEGTVQTRVAELAERISRDYQGKELTAVCVLKGAALFCADLVRYLSVDVTVDFVRAASYGASTSGGAEVSVEKDILSEIKGRHVLLIDGRPPGARRRCSSTTSGSRSPTGSWSDTAWTPRKSTATFRTSLRFPWKRTKNPDGGRMSANTFRLPSSRFSFDGRRIMLYEH